MMMMMMVITITTTTATMIMIMMIMMMRSIINMMIGNRLVSTSGRGRKNDHLLLGRWRGRGGRRRKLDRRGRRLDHRRRWWWRRRRRYCDCHVDHTAAANAFPLLLSFMSPHFNLLFGYEGRELFALDRL